MASGNRNVQTPVEQSSLKVYYSKHNSEVHYLTGILGNSYSTQLAFVQSTQNVQDISSRRKQNNNVEIKGEQSTMQFEAFGISIFNERTNNSNKSSIAVADGHNNQKAEEISQGLPPTSEFFVSRQWPRKSWRRSKHKTNLYRIPDDYKDENQQSSKQTKTHMRSRRICVLICCCTFVILTVLAAIVGTVLSSNDIFEAQDLSEELIICDNITGELQKGPFIMMCTLHTQFKFDKISIYHGPAENPLFAVELYTNGNRRDLQLDSSIRATINVSIVVITFLKVLCHMDGIYHVDLVDSSNFSLASTVGRLTVNSQPEIPTLTLNADQVIDLVFPNGNYYRDERKHVCEGNIGHPPGRLAIDVMYVNGTSFENIPNDSYVEFRTIANLSCNNYERINFAIKFSKKMEGATLRCRVPGAFNNGTNQTLTLIPRNFCDCASPSGIYEHPTRCDAIVQCIQDKYIMYPFGVLCQIDQCLNRAIGMCSQYCSSKCMKTKPPDLCIPPTTPAPSPYISCNESMSVMLYSKPPVVSCTLNQTSAFESINITKISQTSTMQIARISRDGTVTLIYPNDNLNVTFEMRTITIRLTNISCSDEGVYRVDLKTNGVMATAQTQLSLLLQPEIPKLTLNVDQVVDLVFPDGNFYRSEGVHVCEGNIGNPPSSLAIDIMYANGTKFENISQDSYIEFRTVTSLPCSKYERVAFGIKLSEKMEGARVRCRVPRALTNSTVQILTLIPRNFCNCANPNSIQEHPTRCDAVVECKQGNGIMYPLGVLCRTDQCSNSLSGICSLNCTQNCMKTKLSDLCIPPTTTPAPSPYISCSESLLVMLYSKPPIITCTLNETSSFESINITKISTHNSIKDIARILPSGTVVLIGTDDNLNVSFTMGVIYINILNATCADEGVYRVDLNINGAKAATAQAEFSVFQKQSGYAKLQLHPDQIENLGYYRLEYEHTCEADIGYPAGKIYIEILKKGENQFSLLNVSQRTNDLVRDCIVMRATKFGIVFTSDMNEAVIRCRIESNTVLVRPPIYSNNETVSLIPGNFCNCSTPSGIYEHPTRCDAFIQCVPGDRMLYPYGVLCTSDQCRNSNSGICSHNCSTQNCIKTKLPDLCIPLTTTPAPSPYIFCSESMSVMMYSKQVIISCTSNNTSSFEYINITKISSQNTIIEIARISRGGTVIQSHSADILKVTFAIDVVTLNVTNVSCTDEGIYRMVVNTTGVIATAQTQLYVLQKPNGSAVLELNPDQNVGYYNPIFQHRCSADIGRPPSKIEVEILKIGQTQFSILNVNISSISDTDNNCTKTREMKFGIVFSSDMNKAVIRCKITNNMFQNDPPIYSNNGTLSLISANYCDNSTNSLYYKPHPTDCTKFVQCEFTNAYTQSCGSGLCFGVESVDYCDRCQTVKCSTTTGQSTGTSLQTTTTTANSQG